MEQKFNEIIKKAKEIRMKPEEKSDLRARLYAVAKGEAVMSEPVSRQANQRSVIFRFLKPMPMFASLMIALLAGGGVSFASENSLPGDILYPIKVGINEEIRAKITLSAEAKADWEVRRAERRLEEAEKLSNNGELDEEKKAIVEARFEQHAAKAGQQAEKSEERALVKAKAKSLVKLEAVLQKHGRILSRLAEKDSIQAAASMRVAADADVQAEAPVQITDDQGSQAVQNKIEEVSKFFSAETRVPEEFKEEIRYEVKSLLIPKRIESKIKAGIEL
ncbi:MAG: DUF5667 domain-containing protein [bacterium]|nr:DUF5667 domain-containing protein [bacterium]